MVNEEFILGMRVPDKETLDQRIDNQYLVYQQRMNKTLAKTLVKIDGLKDVPIISKHTAIFVVMWLDDFIKKVPSTVRYEKNGGYYEVHLYYSGLNGGRGLTIKCDQQENVAIESINTDGDSSVFCTDVDMLLDKDEKGLHIFKGIITGDH